MRKVLSYVSSKSQFYPTPSVLVREILDGLERSFFDSEEISILEPCAGEGAICREMKSFFEDSRTNCRIDCIEIEKVLRDSLKGQGFNVISDDFENFEPYPSYDLIVMNPPFSKGAGFLLKAYNCLNGDGQLVCLLNAETIKNPFSKEGKLLGSLIERVGEVEFMHNAFSDSEHKTDVEIAVVYLKKPSYENEFDMFGEIKDEILSDEEIMSKNFAEDVNNSGLISIDRVDHIINIYRNAVKQIFQGIDTIQKVKTSLSYLSSEAEQFNINIDEFIPLILEKEQKEAKEEAIRTIRKMSWSYILKATQMDEFLYTKHKQDFYYKIEKGSKAFPFTKENIHQFFLNIHSQKGEYFKKGIIDLFENITSYHNGNRFHQEGWKTNKNWKINKKIIVDWVVSFDTYSYDKSGQFRIGWSEGWMEDLDKVVRKIKPMGYEGYSIREVLRERFHQLGYIKPGDKYDNTCETPYFNLKFFKKGTLHIEFKDEEILKELNKIGGELRRDLGYDDYGKPSEAAA